MTTATPKMGIVLKAKMALPLSVSVYRFHDCEGIDRRIFRPVGRKPRHNLLKGRANCMLGMQKPLTFAGLQFQNRAI